MISIFRRYRSPRDLLEHLISQTEYGVEYGHIFRSMPVLQDISTRLVWRLGDAVEMPLAAGNGPLLSLTCLLTGLEWIAESDALARRAPLRELQTLYTAGLFLRVPELFSLAVTVDGDPWDPMEGEDLGLLQGRGAQVRFRPARPPAQYDLTMTAQRLMMLTRLYPQGSHLQLDIDLKDILWPPPSYFPKPQPPEPDWPEG